MSSAKKLSDIALSVLDLAVITEGGNPSISFGNSLDLARYVEKRGFERFWVAEHHNMVSVASSATAVLIGYLAAGTSSIRIGSGGIMLPNHAPLIVAEQFGTLESMYPGRIDLGLGRAPGTDQETARALRRDPRAAEDFPSQVKELQQYFSEDNTSNSVRAIPGEGLDIPIYLLGSSTYSAQLAAILGLPFAYASHFSPQNLFSALRLYRANFRPSRQLSKPYAIACVNVIAADSDDEARSLATSLYRLALGIIRNTRRPIQPPIESMEGLWTELEKNAVEQMMHFSFVGGPKVVENGLQDFLNETQVEELMVVSHMFDHRARLRSYEILSDIWKANSLS